MLLRVLVFAAAAARAATLQAPAPPRFDAAPQAASLAPLDLSPAAGVYERRGVGLLVVDVKDSTPLHLSLGNRRAHRVVAAALDYAEDSAALFDGVVIRRLGDGQLIAFPRFQNALDAAEAIQAGLPGSLTLRAGVHAGRVVVDGTGVRPEVYGQAVERTLELSSASRGGDIARQGPDGRAVLAPAPARPPLRPQPGLEPRLASVRMTEAAVLFAGLVDWATTYERHGRRLAYAAVKAFHAHVAAIVERHGGFVVKTEGETVMGAFVSAAAAARAGLEIQARIGELRAAAPLGPLAQARVGLTHGRMLRHDSLDGPDFFGNRVNAAARRRSRARPGEVAASESLMAEAGAAALLDGSRRETVSLKGFREPVRVVSATPALSPLDAGAVERLRLVSDAAMRRLARP